MTLHQLTPAALPLLPLIDPLRLPRRLAGLWWRMLQAHLAERHGLRDRHRLPPPWDR
ncbi:hypothetical protein [Phenylobacterium soli]|uniref:hypothetical protein n=1 Tax=Phenylobacterium soli TaxID=2170551 RepID=UPI001401F0E9|nr:hypothetical protein [Phenylobacterium soli]